MAAPWYVLQSNYRKEEALCQVLRQRDLPVYLPRVRVRPVNPRARTLRPYFPGYLFVQIDLRLRGTAEFECLPHAVGLVRCGELPALVPDDVISQLQQHLSAVNEAGGLELYGLKHGDRVRITSGPLAGYEALFDVQLRDSDRVRVLLRLVSDRAVPVELHVGQIAAINT